MVDIKKVNYAPINNCKLKLILNQKYQMIKINIISLEIKKINKL